jgi:hypothetical protein
MWEALAAVGIAALAGLIHLHMRVAVVGNDVKWIKAALASSGLLPRQPSSSD